MSSKISFLLFLCAVASTSAANWEYVQLHVDEIRTELFGAGFDIYLTAYNDNAEVGVIIGNILTTGLEMGGIIVGKLDVEIEYRNLTVEVAKVHLGETLVLTTDMYSAMRSLLEQLEEETKITIDRIYSNLFVTVSELAEKVYAALEEPTPVSCGLVGISSNETVIFPPVDASTPPGNTIRAQAVFAVKESFLLLHAHNKYLDSEIIGSTLSFKTSTDFPTFIGDTGTKVILRTIMLQCYDGSMHTYKFEIPVTTDPIVEPTIKPKYSGHL